MNLQQAIQSCEQHAMFKHRDVTKVFIYMASELKYINNKWYLGCGHSDWIKIEDCELV